MKQLAARDFEDLLQVCNTRVTTPVPLTWMHQCSIPVFEGLLLNEHNKTVLQLLFELGTWHMLASLRLQTDSTLCALEDSTTRLGQMLRHFQSTTCNAYDTYELPSEEAARGRRTATTGARTHCNGPSEDTENLAKKSKKRRVQKVFNLSTYKIHALGDYARAIRLFGTTDGFTTQVVSNPIQVMMTSYSP